MTFTTFVTPQKSFPNLKPSPNDYLVDKSGRIWGRIFGLENTNLKGHGEEWIEYALLSKSQDTILGTAENTFDPQSEYR